LLLLADQLKYWGLDAVLVSVEKIDSMDNAGAAALLEMLQRLRETGMLSHLAVGPKAIFILLAAKETGMCGPLVSSVPHWTDIPW
jgi:hypothetical protein